jgi:hypothetical protein
MMSPTTSIAVLVERIDNLARLLEEKHTQNRKDIHIMRSDIQSLTNQIWLIKLKLAAFAAAGAGVGVGTVDLIKWIHNVLK